MNTGRTPRTDPTALKASRPRNDGLSARLVGGVLICCAALLLGWQSWRWYQQGVPGTPQVPVDWGQSSIRVYGPPDVAITTTVEYSEEPGTGESSNPRVSGSREDISLAAESTRTQPYLVVLELAYGAHLRGDPDVSGSFAVKPIEIGTTYRGPDEVVGTWPVYAPVELFVARVDPMQGGRRLFAGVTGQVSWPVAVTDNARTAVYTPLLRTPGKCSSLGSTETIIDPATWLGRIVPECHASRDTSDTQTIILGGMARNKRLDYANPAPSNPGQLAWSQSGRSFRVDASYVDLDQEANGQRLLFLSGVGVGLAAAGLPIGLQIVSEERRRANHVRRRDLRIGVTEQ